MWSVSLYVSQLPGTRFLSRFFPFTLQPLHPLTQSNSVNQPFSQSYCSRSLSVCQRPASANQLVNQSVIRSQWPVSQSVSQSVSHVLSLKSLFVCQQQIKYYKLDIFSSPNMLNPIILLLPFGFLG